jgi:hypothetical protein
MRRPLRAGSFLIAAAAFSMLVAVPAGAATHEVRPGDSIQAAIDAAAPGDTVDVAAGVFHENLTIRNDHITVRGAGGDDEDDQTILNPGPTPTPSSCTDPASGGVMGACVIGEVDAQFNPGPNTVDDVTLEGLVLDGFSGDGVLAVNASRLRVEDTVARANHGYGISGFHLSDVEFEDDVATDNGEPGFYVGDSPQANADLEDNVAERNGVGREEGLGILIRDSSHGTLEDNETTGNCVGIVVIDTGLNPDPVADWTVKGNHVAENDAACPTGPEGIPPFSGTGILLGGTHAVTVKRNHVVDNRPTLASPFSGGIVVLRTTDVGGAVPTDNVIKRNTAAGNAPADLVWDGSGAGNVFERNRCETSQPDGLCGRSHRHADDD